jgi:ppGpp synthetase/RelA/SpoT-type nucleotidyltranferase
MDDEWRNEMEWLEEQIDRFSEVLPRYVKYAEILQKILRSACKKYSPLSIIQTRPKSVASFGEKAIRKKHKYDDPVNQLTDLCGGRVITTTVDQVKMISKFVEEHFEVDRDNSVDVSQRHATAEFGYRSIHYIVSLKKGIFPNKIVPLEIPDEVYGLKAELQVRTTLEHAWADFYHDTNYKGDFKIPDKWDRELYSIAAVLEGVDKSFSRIDTNLKRYAASYGSYMSKEEMTHQIRKLETVQKYDPQNIGLAVRIGKLAIELEDWDKAIQILSNLSETDHPTIFRDLGVALCKKNKREKESDGFRRGQEYLRKASEPPNIDIDAISSLAGTWKGIDDNRAKELYLKAFELDPTDPYPLGNFIELEIVEERDTSFLSMLKPSIKGAIERSKDQIDVNMNLPWAYYDMAKFYLFLNNQERSIPLYAKAVQVSKSNWEIETSLRSLERLGIVKDKLPGYDLVRAVLVLALYARNKDRSLLTDCNLKPKELDKDQPVVIVAGGCDEGIEVKMKGYRDFLISSFKDFNGVIISGGTTSGISGLVGEISKHYGQAITTIGYVPKEFSEEVEIDFRYDEIRKTDSDSFTYLEPIHYWMDILASGIIPKKVKVLGINGGQIASFEYKLALALGAEVAILEDSHGEAEAIINDGDWNKLRNLSILSPDVEVGSDFIMK